MIESARHCPECGGICPTYSVKTCGNSKKYAIPEGITVRYRRCNICKHTYKTKEEVIEFKLLINKADKPILTIPYKSDFFKTKGAYYNQHQMKLNRLVKLQQAKGKCEVCGVDAKTVHHIDESTDNHVISNLVVLCNHHHCLIHNKDGKYKTSKYKRKYGMTAKEMATKLKISQPHLSNLLKNETKKKQILEKLGITEKENTFE